MKMYEFVQSLESCRSRGEVGWRTSYGQDLDGHGQRVGRNREDIWKAQLSSSFATTTTTRSTLSSYLVYMSFIDILGFLASSTRRTSTKCRVISGPTYPEPRGIIQSIHFPSLPVTNNPPKHYIVNENSSTRDASSSSMHLNKVLHLRSHTFHGRRRAPHIWHSSIVIREGVRRLPPPACVCWHFLHHLVDLF